MAGLIVGCILTLAAVVMSLLIAYANGMRSSPSHPTFTAWLYAIWAVIVVYWTLWGTAA